MRNSPTPLAGHAGLIFTPPLTLLLLSLLSLLGELVMTLGSGSISRYSMTLSVDVMYTAMSIDTCTTRWNKAVNMSE